MLESEGSRMKTCGPSPFTADCLVEEALGHGNCLCGCSAEAIVDLPLEMRSPANCVERHGLGPLFPIYRIKTQEVEPAIWGLLGPVVKALH